MGEKLYFNQGVARRKQIYEWFEENVYTDAFLIVKLKEVRNEVIQGDLNTAFNEFNQITRYFVNHQTKFLIGYIIEENQIRFGYDRIDRDLFNGVMSGTLRSRKKRLTRHVKRQRVTTKSIKDFERERRIAKPIIYGIDPSGKRRQAKVQRVVVRQHVQVRLRDKKTGRFLKQTKAFKKRIKS